MLYQNWLARCSVAILLAVAVAQVGPLAAQDAGGGAAGGAGGGAGGGNTGGGNTGGGSTGGTGGRNTGGGGVGTSNAPPLGGQQSTPSFGDIQRPIFLSGKVMMADGSVPPSQVSIQRVCFSTPITEAYTDNKGHFSFELGRRMGVMLDASQGGLSDGRLTGGTVMPGSQTASFTERDLASCEIRATLPGYFAESVLLAGRRFMDNPDIGTFILHPLAGVNGFTFSATSGMAPKSAQKAYEKGVQQINKKKFADAEKELTKATDAYSKYAAAWTALGVARISQKNIEGAQDAWAKAVEADDRYLTPHLQLMQLYGEQSRWEDLARESNRVIQLNAVQYPQAYYMAAVAQFNLKQYDDAEKSAAEAVRLDTQHHYPRSEFILGLLRAMRNDHTSALETLRSYSTRVQGADLEQAKQQIAAIEKFVAGQQ